MNLKKYYLFFLILFFLMSCGGGGTSSGGGTTTTTTTNTQTETGTTILPEQKIASVDSSANIIDNCSMEIDGYAYDNTSTPIKDATLILDIPELNYKNSATTDENGEVNFNVNVCNLSKSGSLVKSAIKNITYKLYPDPTSLSKEQNLDSLTSSNSIPLNEDNSIAIDKIVSKYQMEIQNSTNDAINIKILAYNMNNELIKNTTLIFELKNGEDIIKKELKTDDNGVIFFNYKPENLNQDIILKADSPVKSSQFESNIIKVPVENETIAKDKIPNKLIITDYEQNNLPDNASITIQVLNENNAPISNTNLEIQTDCGKIDKSNGITDSNGEINVNYFKDGCENNNSKIIFTTSSGIKLEIPLLLKPEILKTKIISITNPSGEIILSKDNNSVKISGKVYYSSDNSGVPDEPLTIFSSCGNFSKEPLTILTDDQGFFSFEYSIGEDCIYGKDINLSIIGTEDTKSLKIHLKSNIKYITVQSSKESVLFGKDDNITINLTAFDQDNLPASNEYIQVKSDCGLLYKNYVITNSEGKASFIFNPICLDFNKDKITLKLIIDGNEEDYQTSQLSISYSNVVDKIILSASKLNILADGADSTTITAIALNKYNGPVDNVTLNIKSDKGIVSTNTLTTDSSGTCKFTFSAGATKENTNAKIEVSTIQFNKLISNTITIQIQGISLSVFSDKQFIKADGSDYATVKIEVKDPANKPVSNFPVNVYFKEKDYADIKYNGNIIQDDNLTTYTDLNGNVIVNIIGQSPGNSTLYIDSGGISKEINFTVSNEKFEFSEIDNTSISNINSIDIGKYHTLKFEWLDENGNGVNDNLSFSTNLGYFTKLLDNGTCDTNTKSQSLNVSVNNGVAYACYRSDYIGNSNIIASNVNGDKSTSITLLNVSNNPVAKIILGASQTIIPISTDTVKYTSKIKALVLDGNNFPIANKKVIFYLENTTGGGETIQPVEAYTDSSGYAYAIFTSGSKTTSGEGVKVKATVDGISSSLNIVIVGKAVHISLGKGDKLYSINEDTMYRKPITVIVTDATGAPINGAIVNLKVIPVSYTKGYTQLATDSNGNQYLQIIDTQKDIPNEDVNLNNILDPGEDINGNGKLDPGNPVVLNPGNQVETEENGYKIFYIEYPKCYAHWLKIKIIATTEVEGDQSSAILEMVLPYSQNDYDALTVPCNSPFGK